MSSFESLIFDHCRSTGRSVAFPEADDPRVQEAIGILLEQKLCKSVVMWCKDFNLVKGRIAQKVKASVDQVCIDGLSVLKTKQVEFQKYLTTYYEKKKKAVSSDQFDDPLFQAGYLLQIGVVDAVVAGSIATTSNVIRAALVTIGMEEGIKSICGGFVMAKEKSVLVFADGAVLIEPTSEQLCDIAAASVSLLRKISKEEPRLAFLSFSTKGSAQHPSVDKVKSGFDLFKSRFPKVLADGELQFDAAFVPDVANRKAVGSAIKGAANIFVFPDLNSGNIGYKMAQRLAGYKAYGPLLLGLKKPYSDLSRGASPDDIVMASCLSILRAP